MYKDFLRAIIKNCGVCNRKIINNNISGVENMEPIDVCHKICPIFKRVGEHNCSYERASDTAAKLLAEIILDEELSI